MKMTQAQKNAIWDEALQHDGDNERYWFGGIPKKLWDDDDTVAEIQRQDREFVEQWNQVFRAEDRAHREGRKWDWDVFSGMLPKDILRSLKR